MKNEMKPNKDTDCPRDVSKKKKRIENEHHTTYTSFPPFALRIA
jgi:hypothetical protein